MQQKPITGKLSGAGKMLFYRLDNFLFKHPETGCQAIVFFRIAIGMLVLVHLLAILPDLQLLFGYKTIMPAEVAALYSDDLLVNTDKIRSLTGLPVSVFLQLFCAAYVLLAVLVISGIFTRYAALALLLLNMALLNNNVFFIYGVDYFTRMSLFYLVIFPAGREFSVQNLIPGRRAVRAGNYLVYRRFIQLHLVFIYLFSGVDKVIGYNWRNGEAIWKAINLPHANNDLHINFGWMADFPEVPLILGWSVVLTEILYPLIFLKALRKILLPAAIAMHLSIALVFNLYFFSSIMIIWNITAFFDFRTGARSSPKALPQEKRSPGYGVA
jgi:hypothetical protein